MNIVFDFLKLLNVNFNKETVNTLLDTHANHPSLLSISDLLDEYDAP